MSLPFNTRGYVGIGDVSDPLTALVESEAAGGKKGGGGGGGGREGGEGVEGGGEGGGEEEEEEDDDVRLEIGLRLPCSLGWGGGGGRFATTKKR